MAQQLFRHPEKLNPADAAQNERIGEETRRLRTLEGRYANLDRRLEVTESNMIASDRKMHLEIQAVRAQLRDAQNDLAEMREKMQDVIAALRDSAKREDVDVIRKELSFYEPLNFVTRSQAEKIVRDVLEEKKE